MAGVVRIAALELVGGVVTVMLLVLDRLQPSDPLDNVLGKIIIQAVPLSIGASVVIEAFGRRGEKHQQMADSLEN